MILLIAIAFVVVIRVMATRYKKIPPNAVGIFYGRKYRAPDGVVRGFRIVAGGGSLLWPIVEHLQIMSTGAFQAKIDEQNIPNVDNVKISVKGVATCKLSSIPEDLYSAAMAFLGKTDAEIEDYVRNILMGHLRSIIGKLSIDEILRKRDTFNKQVVEESTEELKRLGVQVITLVIQEVTDAHGYIDALGRKAVAEAIRDADIKVAQAKAETQKKVSEAEREAAVVTAQNEVQTAEAQRDRDVKKAQFKVAADTEKAKADQALGIATADQEKTLRVKQAERDAAEKEAQIKVQEKEAERKQQELTATVVRVAEAAKQKAIIEAEASKQAVVVRAEGDKTAATLSGEGEAAKIKAVLVAKAEGEAAIRKQALLAEAEGQAAMKGKVLLAEAEGTQKLAQALAQMTESAKLILILDRLPVLFDKGGEAAAKVAQAIFSSVAAPLGNIDELRIIDLGGSGRPLEQLASVVPNTVFRFLSSLKAQGIDVKQLLGKLGINIDDFTQMIGEKPAGGAKPDVEPPAPMEKRK
jgi:flotillin